ncbi:MAG: DoxX family protein [Novosphingobium sp.]
MANLAAPLGRLLMAIIFILGGLSKFGDLAGTGAYMQSAGVPAALALPAAAFELLAGLAILLGWQTRIVAPLLAGFCVVTAALFHTNFADQVQMVMFMKNLGLAGGFLTLYAHGAGAMSLDARKAG